MGTNVLRGRTFGPQDDERASRVAVVNEAAARYYFGRTDAVGETFQLVESLLFGVRSSDSVTFVASAAMLLTIGAAAAYWPARRGAHLNPIAALRVE